ncbi:MAG: hypothetical protein ACC683_07265 [Acidimicrobiia bacterium]
MITPRNGRIPPEVKDTYLTALEEQVRELVGREPKDFARAAVLIYDICRLRGRHAEAEYLSEAFDLPAMVLYQVPPLLRAVHRADEAPAPRTRDSVLDRIDDLTRLVILTLEGDANADVVQRLRDLRDAVAMAPDAEDRSSAIASAGDRLAHLVNAFFFDRLTAMPTLRDYVVDLELGM